MEVASARSAGGLSARVPLILAAVLGVVILGLVTTSVLLVLQVFEKRQDESARAAAVAAARREAINLLTLDHQTLDRDVNRILAGATGSFRDEFASRTTDLEKYMTEAESSSQGEVQSAGIVSFDEDSAEALVVADQTVRSNQVKQGVSRHYRLSMTLERHENRWLVSKVSYVG